MCVAATKQLSENWSKNI